MKKILALVLALMMVLSAVAALAEEGTPSITPGDIETAVTNNPKVKVIVNAPDSEQTAAIKEQLLNGDEEAAIEYIKESVSGEAGSAVAAIIDKYTVDEVQTQVIGAEPEDLKELNSLTVTYTFNTKYDKGETVYILIGIPGEGTDVEWVLLQGTADEEGNVTVTFDEALLAKLGTDEYVVVVISEKE